MDIRRVARSVTVVLLLLSAAVPARAADAVGAHVRATERGLSQMLAEAAARSATLQALIERLDQSDVIVYVEHGVLETRLQGRLRFAGARSGWRYLRVEIDCRMDLTRQIALLGHELQHAVEIAGTETTVDERSLRHLYREIGFALDSRESRFETDHAIETGLLVQREWQASAQAMATARRAANY